MNVDKNKVEINEIVEKIFGKEKEVRKKIIITSGRGKPHNIPVDLSFLSITAIQNAIETLYDKYLLVKLLYNSRKTI